VPATKQQGLAPGPAAEKKRGRGRPQKLVAPVTTTIRVEREDLDRLDEWARSHGLSRSQATAAAIHCLR
jgi:hypothetical protein